MTVKRALSFGEGTKAVWHCDQGGVLSCYASQGPIEQSQLCFDFPQRMSISFLLTRLLGEIDTHLSFFEEDASAAFGGDFFFHPL